MTAIVECIPNFSEGRRVEIIDHLVHTIDAVPDVRILHRTSDADHNRTVITLIGTPDAALEAAYAAIAEAAKWIDMEQHQGVHPRLGAADVVPFVPIKGITMAGCVQLARQLAQRVGQQLELPVYLYEEAATRPDRRNLADVRRGEYEQLKKQISTPARQPDFGPASVGSAGAVVIGARHPLIAYNVFLSTDDVQIAKRIAKVIRHSSGGLVGVKALGLLVQGQAQVSMNLTDYRRTPIQRVMTLIHAEAVRYGIMVDRSEIIGLIPQDALFDVAAWYLQLRDFVPSMVLENHLQSSS